MIIQKIQVRLHTLHEERGRILSTNKTIVKLGEEKQNKELPNNVFKLKLFTAKVRLKNNV